MGATRRTKRLGALIQSELGDLLLRRVQDPRLRQVSLTAVDVSPDLSQAKVYYSLWDEDRRGQVEQGFAAASGFLRRELAKRLHLKTMPRLIPVYDSSLVSGARMSATIEKVRSQDELEARRRGEAFETDEDKA
ncbi:MAG: 30S ribosome-binding factor RbfA [Desulfarculaceae bacterium]